MIDSFVKRGDICVQNDYNNFNNYNIINNIRDYQSPFANRKTFVCRYIISVAFFILKGILSLLIRIFELSYNISVKEKRERERERVW